MNEENEKLKIPYPVIVEGKYDRQKLAAVIEAQIITTEGFGIFKSREKAALIRALAQKTPVIVLTDPDGAGKLIRSHLSGLIPPDRLIKLYIPRICGKEKRKSTPSAEGVLGVEGMETSLLRELFAPFCSADALTRAAENPLSKTDFLLDGLSGGSNSSARRDEISKKAGLPSGMSANSLLAALQIMLSYDEYLALVGRGEK